MNARSTAFFPLVFFACALSVCSLSACSTGILYTDVVVPLSTDMNNTPVGEVQAQGSSHFVKEPVSSLGISAEWSSYAIGEAAAAKPLGELNYADLKVFSVFGKVYQRTTVLVYGDEAAKK